VFFARYNVKSKYLAVLELASHVERMSDDRAVKKVFLAKPDGRSKAGRQKLRWLDGIERDVK
jgi:hypothetical protein